MVEKFVMVAHGDLDETTTLREKVPGLVNACWDWGAGDWETGLGGASHVGRADIAEYLLAHGARMDLFAAAMLGRYAIVKAALDADPALVRVPGPHGIPLIAHAVNGGQEEVAKLIREVESRLD